MAKKRKTKAATKKTVRHAKRKHNGTAWYRELAGTSVRHYGPGPKPPPNGGNFE